MSLFDAEPNTVRRWQVMRCVPGHVTEFMVLCDRLLPVTTHWVGHSVLCPRDECSLCEFLPQRALWYLPVSSSGQVWLLELSSASSANLEQHCKLLHSALTPGQVVRMKRTGNRSPVRFEVLETRTTTRALTLLEVAARVMVLFKFPMPHPNEGIDEYQIRTQASARLRADGYAAKIKAGESVRQTKQGYNGRQTSSERW